MMPARILVARRLRQIAQKLSPILTDAQIRNLRAEHCCIEAAAEQRKTQFNIYGGTVLSAGQILNEMNRMTGHVAQ